MSITSPEKEKYIFFIYDVITWEKSKKALLITTRSPTEITLGPQPRV